MALELPSTWLDQIAERVAVLLAARAPAPAADDPSSNAFGAAPLANRSNDLCSDSPSRRLRPENDLEALFPEPVLTAPEVAKRLRRHPETVNRAIKRGALQPIDGLGRPYLLTRTAVIAWALGDVTSTDVDCETRTPDRGEAPEPTPKMLPADVLTRRRAMAPKRKAA